MPEARCDRLAPIIKHGNSYIYRTRPCSFRSPRGTQTVVPLSASYQKLEKLYPDSTLLENGAMRIGERKDFSGNVYLLTDWKR